MFDFRLSDAEREPDQLLGFVFFSFGFWKKRKKRHHSVRLNFMCGTERGSEEKKTKGQNIKSELKL